MANQLLDKFQSKEGAQVALQDIEKLMEKASVLRSNPGFLSLEFEAILTPQLQVLTHIHPLRPVVKMPLFYCSMSLKVP